MARLRYRVTVYGQRCGGPTYSYVAHESVKPAKVSRLVGEVAQDVLSHESRGIYSGSVVRGAHGAVVRVYGAEGYCKFVVRAARK